MLDLLNSKFSELINIEVAENLYKNWDQITDVNWGCKEFGKDQNSQKRKLKKLIDKYKRNEDTEYHYATGRTGGRLFVEGVGLQNIKREIRNAISSEFYYDFDMKNAQCQILNEILKKKTHTIYPTLNEYCTNRDKYYHLKQDVIEILFGENLKPIKNEADYNFMLNLRQDIENIKSFFAGLPENESLIKELKRTKKGENVRGRMISKILNDHEGIILDLAIEWLYNHDYPIECIVLIFDGFMFPKKDLEPEEIKELLEGLNAYILEKTDIKVEFINKDFGDMINTEFEENIKYRKQKEEFELTHAKIINKSFYIQAQPDNELIYYTDSKLEVSFKHIENGFITRWVKDPKMRVYDDLQVYPIAEDCPKNIYNLWIPFSATKLPQVEYLQSDLDFVLNHIKILCNNETETYDYFIAWIAFMLKYPNQKSKIITFISAEGAGKNSLLEFLKKIIGEKKVLDTTKPSQFCWGQFNGCMVNAYLVCLNEISKKEMELCDGVFKGLITDPTILINKKGIEAFPMQSFHKFISFTNNEDPLRTSKNDRRLALIRCSDELCIDHSNPSNPKNEELKKYWDKLYELMKKPELIRGLYDYFMKIECKDFNTRPIPRTEYHEDILQANEPLEQMFIREYIMTLKHAIVKISSLSLFKSFEHFLKEQGYKDYDTKNAKFNLRIKNLKIDGVETKHTNSYNTKVIDTAKARKHFNLPEIELIENDFIEDKDEEVETDN